jgi:hypothetical protein
MTKKVLNIDPEKIHLVFIEEVSVDINDTDITENKVSSLETNIAHLTAYNLEDKKFLFGLELLLTNNNESNNSECKFRYNFHFIIDNLEEMYNINDDGLPVFKKSFVGTLSGISYSTLRGIVFEKTRKLNWDLIQLPIINPMNLLDSWISQE